jgi:hypothetical protein
MGHWWKLAAAAVLICGLIPIPYLASPEWNVLVVDESGRPLSNILVRLDYENYSVEESSHEDEQTTDSNGRVMFPSHKSSASILRRCYYTAQSAMALAHASFGPSATVDAFGSHLEELRRLGNS